ncbi:serine hydrolase [Maribacter sp. 4G9]|uniref:serine hydrolase n=1 Tax=Maribacter sp. 4G9 TaxID=1889777 RepID=UPI000C15C75A|nr:serine hydrolase [Maribacter sp. 4G9]PIB30599.1 hypothetical protein BFP75_02375 [Maribacter sp. 4G9]
MKTVKRAITLVFSLVMASCALSQDSDSEKLVELFNFYEKQGLFNGSVLVSKNGDILLNKGCGYQDANKEIHNTSKSIFQTYSITKAFTSTVILRLVEENRLSLSDKLSKFYPDFPNGDDISIENLLTHTSGIYDYTKGNDMPDQTEESFVEFERTKPLDFPVGTAWSYSNSGYYFLGYIIQRVTGMPYEQAVAKYILDPLDMRQSGFAFKGLTNENKAVGYKVLTDRKQIESIIYDPPAPFAAGGLYSTVEDLYKFYQGMKQNKVLKEGTLSKAYTPFKNNYGYGWVIDTMFDKKSVGHSGAGAGFRSNFLQLPEDDICIVLLSNCEEDLKNITNGILNVLYNQPYKIPMESGVKSKTLQKYKGTYRVNDDFIIYVSLDNNKLVAQPNGQPKSILYPENENSFYVQEINGYIHFEENGQNQIDTLLIDNQGRTIKAKKINPNWGIVGSASVNGWEGKDIELTKISENGIWAISNLKLNDGEFKFRFNNDWTLNLGEYDNKILILDGDNIKVKKGVYNIILDLTDHENPKYKISKAE